MDVRTTGAARRIELSVTGFMWLALASVATLWLIMVTGAAVRLTDSGLGCRHWPGCACDGGSPAFRRRRRARRPGLEAGAPRLRARRRGGGLRAWGRLRARLPRGEA